MKLVWKNFLDFLSSEKRKIYQDVASREKYIIFLFFGFLVFCYLVVFLGGKFIAEPVVKMITDSEAQKIEKYLELEKSEALRHSDEMATSHIFDSHIASGDVLRLVALANQEKIKRGLTFIVTVNREGIALSRVPVVANRGDYVFQTVPWGQATSRGEKMSAVGVGRSFPLIIVGASPILEGDSVGGAIFSGYWLDSNYAKHFRDKYLAPEVEMAFYSKEYGVVGGTFENGTEDIVNSFLNTGTNFIQNDQSNFAVHIGDRDYFIKNIFFENASDDKVGGAIIFLPHSPVKEGIIFSSLFLVAFLLVVCLIYKKSERHPKSHTKYAVSLFIFIIISFFITTTLIYVNILKRQSFNMANPNIPIYNSVFKFEPEWSVFDITTEQNIAVKIISGGETINAVHAEIEFDPKMINVSEIITLKSFCDPDLFLEKSIDNISGVVNIACARPGGIDEDEGTLAELLVQALTPGEFALRFGSGSKILAHDGLGTNVLRQAQDASFRALSSDNTGNESGLLLFSPSHSNSERWYNHSDILVNWPSQGENYRYVFKVDKNPDTVLSTGEAITQNYFNTTVLSDGVYYAHVAPIADGFLGKTSRFKIKVDSTPPESPVIRVSNVNPKVGEIVRVEVLSSDELSGLQKTYYYQIDDSIRLPLGNELAIPFQEVGDYTLTVRAFDNAGNFSDSSLEINVNN